MKIVCWARSLSVLLHICTECWFKYSQLLWLIPEHRSFHWEFLQTLQNPISYSSIFPSFLGLTFINYWSTNDLDGKQSYKKMKLAGWTFMDFRCLREILRILYLWSLSMSWNFWQKYCSDFCLDCFIAFIADDSN